jgi:hypothetical protein
VTFTSISVPADFNLDSGSCSQTESLAADGECTLKVRFNPDTVGAKSGSVVVHSNAADVSVAVDGTGIQTELTRTPASRSFGNRDIDDGPTAAQDVTIKNTGTQQVTFTAIALPEHFNLDSGSCSPTQSLAANAECTLKVRFDPVTVGAKSGSVVVHSNAADVSVAVDGTGIQTELTRTPASRSFGNRDIDDGPTASQDVTIKNTGTQQVTFTSIAVPEHFNLDSGSCAPTESLAANAECTLKVRFDPVTVGAKSGSVVVHSNAADVSASVDGTGIQTELSRIPATGDLAFGDRDIDDGPTASQDVTVKNTGTEDVQLASIAVPAHFGLDTGSCSQTELLEDGEECVLKVRFDPSSVGAKSGDVVVDSNAADVTVHLTGRGVQTQLARTPATGDLAFGQRDIDDGPTTSQDVTVKNTGTETVTFTSIGVPAHFDLGPGSCSQTQSLAADAECVLKVRFDPSSTGAKSGTVVVHSDAADLSVAVNGTGTQTQLTGSTGVLPFGSQDIDDGGTAAQEATVTNTGNLPVTLSAVNVGGADAAMFERQTGQASDCAAGDTLQPDVACQLRFRFDPPSPGAKSAAASVESNAAPVNVDLTGTGTQSLLALDPTALAFGRRGVASPATAAQESTVANTGTEPITLSGLELSGAGASQFTRLSGDPTDCAAGGVVAAGANCKLRVAFDPSTTGAKAALLTVTSNTADVVVALTGTGTPSLVARGLPGRASATAGKRFRFTLSTRGGTIRGVGVTLAKAGGKQVGRSSLGTISGKVKVTMKLKRQLAAGRYVLTARGRAAGRPVDVLRLRFRLR